jgi:hypothetical protein
MKRCRNRRHFLSQTATATAALPLAHTPTSQPSYAANHSSPNEQIRLGVIGIGPRGIYDLKAILTFEDVRCVAMAEVQASRRDAGKKLVDDHYGQNTCELYRDFRGLLDRKDVDAVLVATDDRWHAAAAIPAAKAGKDFSIGELIRSIFATGPIKPTTLCRLNTTPARRTSLSEVTEDLKRVKGLDVSAHARNFFDCMRSREFPVANQDVMRRPHIACHAAAIARALKRKLKLDPVKEEFINDPEANLLRSRPDRIWF